MQTLLYILPTNFEHVGITKKIQGQLTSLKKRFNTTLIYMSYKKKSFIFQKLIAYIAFELKSIVNSNVYHIIYMRYNPKSLLINCWLIFLSHFKPVYIEHNTIMDTELVFLNRLIEHRWHLLTLQLMRLGNITHIAVNQELQQHLKSKQLKNVIYSQNGYEYTPTISSDIKPLTIQNISDFKKKFQKIAIFCGNGYPWHGCNDIINLLQAEKHIGLIIVGPYSLPPSSQYIHFEHASSNTITYLIEQSDFAISTFRWDMINISVGSPLKSRQYLCHGCPILVNYYDCASDFDALKPYVINYRKHKENSFSIISSLNYSRHELKKKANELLSWNRYFELIF